MKYQINIRSNEGYGADQIKNAITVGELREALEDLQDDDAEIITYDMNNGYGAQYGKLTLSIDESSEDEDEDY